MNDETLLLQWDENTTILTPNNRMATHLHGVFDQSQQKKGRKVWPTPAIDSMTAWLSKQILTITPSVVPLSKTDPLVIWEEIIEQDPHSSLLQLSATAKEAYAAFGLLTQWQLDFDDQRLYTTESSRTLIRWAKSYKTYLKTHHYADLADLSRLATEALASQQLTSPAKIMTVGFLEFTPDIERLLESLSQQGCVIEHFQLSAQTTAPARLKVAANTTTEIQAMAQWAKDNYSKNPKARIACVVPQLTALRHALEQQFYQVFDIDQQVTGELPFNISSGLSLFDTPIIFSALMALKIKSQKIHIDELSFCLRSQYLCDDETDLTQQALIDAKLHETRQEYFSLSELIKTLKAINLSEKIVEKFSALQKIQHNNNADSAGLFSDILIAWGWPGCRALTSLEYQACQRWQELGCQILAMDKPFPQLLSSVNALCRQTTFQAQTVNSRIQVLGILEATGMLFDHTWIMGMDHESWPTAAHANPFLPTHLQRTLNMPHASSERELAFCEKVTAQLLKSAPDIIVSYSDADKKLLPSPLIRGCQALTIDKPVVCLSSRLDTLSDDQGPSIGATEKIRGGTSIFKLQALCPFRAFAQLRLRATAIEFPETGIDNRTRGLIIHKTLELIWRELKTQENLLRLNEASLNKLINDKATIALSGLSTDKTTLYKLELKRLGQVISDWLNLEKQRQPFTVVATEQWQSTQIDTLKIHIQVDRVDQIESGEHILIDYKTGRPNINDWFGDRPSEPQLPLYAVSHQQPVCAMSFAQLRANDLRFKGVSKEKNLLPGCKPLKNNWDEQVIEWQDTLTKLSRQFSMGEAKVAPKEPGKTCQYCELQTLCRVYEKAPQES